MSDEHSPTSTFQLLLASSQGDADAYGKLFSRYSEKLYNFIYYLTFSREDSEDITSDAFIKVYEAIQGRDVASFNFQAYLYKTAKNLALNSMARRKRDGLTMEEALEVPEPNPAMHPEMAALINEQRLGVLQVADSLTDDQQTALLLRELEGFPYDTIAQVLDSNPNAVGVLLSRARLRFREVYRMSQTQTQGIPDPCVAILPALSRYLDSEATSEEIQVIQEHLADCPICNENLKSMREASVTYRALVPMLPLASLKLWTAAKGAILAGKAAMVAGHAAGSAAGSVPTAASATAASSSVAATGATATAVATTGMAVSTKIVAVIVAVLVAGGVGTGGYYGYRKVVATPTAKTTEKIVFIREGNVWLMNPDGTGGKQLTSDGSSDEPALSLDGKKIAYEGRKDHYPNPATREAPAGLDAYSPQLYLMDSDGSNPVRLTEASMGNCGEASFFPDGNRVTFHRSEWNMLPGEGSEKDFLSIIDLTTRKMTDLASHSDIYVPYFNNPVVSFDGRSIYWWSGGHQAFDCSVEKTDVATLRQTTVLEHYYNSTDGENGYAWPALSADGKSLAATLENSLIEPRSDIVVSDSNGHKQNRMSPDIQTAGSEAGFESIRCSWTSNGDLILSAPAYIDYGSAPQFYQGVRGVYLLNSRDSSVRQLIGDGYAASYGHVVER